MGLAIILRDQLSINRFLDLIIDVINRRFGDNALLCSGFFQENRGRYFASKERNFARVLASSGVALTTVGVHNNAWKKSYSDFRDSLVNAGVNVSSKYKSGLNWHAKVFILSTNQTRFLELLGAVI